MSASPQEFRRILMEAIDEGLSVLGEEPRSAFYQYLATMHSLSREDIPDRVTDFSNGVKRAMGGASTVVQRVILRKLFQKLGSSFRESLGLEFADYVTEARRLFEAAIQQGSQAYQADHGRSKKSQLPG